MKHINWKNIKRILALFGLLLATFLIVFFNELIYGINQYLGQNNLIDNAKSIDFYLNEDTYPDSLKERIKLVREIRQFAIDSLELYNADNYKKIYDQKGEDVLWIIRACKPYELRPFEWTFPFAGSFPYKGHFDREKVIADSAKFARFGYDVGIRPVRAWSTLGYFEDPILSNMLYWSEGELAETIIHEMTHSTIFVYSDIEYNENLATFIGEYGAKRFLSQKYGQDSDVLKYYSGDLQDQKKFIDHMLHGAMLLDTLFKSFDEKILNAEKDRLKYDLIEKIALSTDTINFLNSDGRYVYKSAENLNNTNFAALITYHAKQNDFSKDFDEVHKGDFKNYLDSLKKVHPLH